MADTESLLAEALQAVNDSRDSQSLDAIRVNYLGKKGSITALLKSLGQLPEQERPAAGESINLAKNHAPKVEHLGRKKPKGSAAVQRREAKKRKALRARSKK